MKIDSIKNGIVIDHIKAKNGMRIYNALSLNELDCSVAVITNVKSNKMGRKDIIKIDKEINVDIEMLGFLDSNATINIIKDKELVEKKNAVLPEKLVNIAKCKNPRCITSCEREIKQIFYLTDRKNEVYRCKYCETALD